MFSCRLVLQSCWFASSVASVAGGEMLLLFYEFTFAIRVQRRVVAVYRDDRLASRSSRRRLRQYVASAV